MRFLLDAHIPRRICTHLNTAGHECAHVETLHDGNRTSDTDIARSADDTGAVVVTKDSDFRVSHQLGQPPARLLLIAVGNTSNNALAALLERFLPTIAEALAEPGLVELHRDHLVLLPRSAVDQ